MEVNVNAAILRDILDDEKYKTELIEFLSEIVDEELEKGSHMDTALVTDCTEMIFELENGYEALNLERESANKIIKFCHRETRNKNGFKTVAAVIAILLIAHTTTYYTLPAYAEVVDTFVEQVMDLLRNTSEKTDDGSSIYSELILEEPDGFDNRISSPEEADLKGFKVYAVDFDGNKTEIPLSNCLIEKQLTDDNGTKKLEVAVSYKGCTEITYYIITQGEK